MIPKGWKLVPEVATEPMIRAGKCQLDMGAGIEGAWERMLANAPNPPAQQDGKASGGECHHVNTVIGSDGVRWCQHCEQQVAHPPHADQDQQP